MTKYPTRCVWENIRKILSQGKRGGYVKKSECETKHDEQGNEVTSQ